MLAGPIKQIDFVQDVILKMSNELIALALFLDVLKHKLFPSSRMLTKTNRFAFSCGQIFECLVSQPSVLSVLTQNSVVAGIINFS